MAAPTIALAQANAAPSPVTIELNKLEPHDATCRLLFVVNNRGDKAYQTLKLDVIFFGNDGVISRRLALDFAPLRATKIAVTSFDLAGQSCDQIGQVLVNDAIDCKIDNVALPNCLDAITMSSLAKARLTK